MLIDDVLESEFIKSAIGDESFSLLSNTLMSAHRFELSESFSLAASEISETNLSAFMKAISACRAPAPLCWLEVAHSHRPCFKNDNLSNPGFEPTVRAGILLEQKSEDGMAYKLSLFFRGATSGAALSPLSILVDLRDEDNLATAKRKITVPDADEVRKSLSQKYSGQNLEAAIRLEEKTCPTGNDYTDVMMQNLIDKHGRDFISSMVVGEVNNWGGEIMYWLSALALLNTRNVGSRSEVSMGKLNKSRAAKGKKPLMDYSVCTIDRVRPTKENDSGFYAKSKKRAHFVRGHFKLRKTGVFWWRPSVRGDWSEGSTIKTYRIEHT